MHVSKLDQRYKNAGPSTLWTTSERHLALIMPLQHVLEGKTSSKKFERLSSRRSYP